MDEITFHEKPERAEPNDQYRTEKRWLLYVYVPIVMFVGLTLSLIVDERNPYFRVIDILFGLGINIQIFAWCRVDARERDYELHRLFPFAIILLAVVAFPYYLLRSRGLVAGLKSLGWSLLYIAACTIVTAIASLIVVVPLAMTGLIQISE